MRAYQWSVSILIFFLCSGIFANDNDVSDFSWDNVQGITDGIDGWAETSEITSVSTDDEICIGHSKGQSWPQRDRGISQGSTGNLWIIFKLEGTYHARILGWLDMGETCMFGQRAGLSVNDVYRSFVYSLGFMPEEGEEGNVVGFMATTWPSGNGGSIGQERSDILWHRLPTQDGQGGGRVGRTRGAGGEELTLFELSCGRAREMFCASNDCIGFTLASGEDCSDTEDYEINILSSYETCCMRKRKGGMGVLGRFTPALETLLPEKIASFPIQSVIDTLTSRAPVPDMALTLASTLTQKPIPPLVQELIPTLDPELIPTLTQGLVPNLGQGLVPALTQGLVPALGALSPESLEQLQEIHRQLHLEMDDPTIREEIDEIKQGLEIILEILMSNHGVASPSNPEPMAVCPSDKQEPDYRAVGGRCLPSCSVAERSFCEQEDCTGLSLSTDATRCSDNTNYHIQTLQDSYEDACCIVKRKTLLERLVESQGSLSPGQ